MSSCALVVGAGASVEYGLPLGHELAKRIAEAADLAVMTDEGQNLAEGTLTRGDPLLWGDLSFKRGWRSPKQMAEFVRAGQALASAARSLNYSSIDEALDKLSGWPEAVQLGKICITQQILLAESKSILRIEEGAQAPDPSAGENGWIQRVLSMLVDDLDIADIPRAFDNITFVNFNYDRCIEHYLYWALQRLGLTAEVAAEAVRSLKMIRPYGTFGSVIPEEDKSQCLRFGEVRFINNQALTDRIRTFLEGDVLHDEKQLENAFVGASQVIFLGFGFQTLSCCLCQDTERAASRSTRRHSNIPSKNGPA